jgi:hypothetical protein
MIEVLYSFECVRVRARACAAFVWLFFLLLNVVSVLRFSVYSTVLMTSAQINHSFMRHTELPGIHRTEIEPTSYPASHNHPFPPRFSTTVAGLRRSHY